MTHSSLVTMSRYIQRDVDPVYVYLSSRLAALEDQVKQLLAQTVTVSLVLRMFERRVCLHIVGDRRLTRLRYYCFAKLRAKDTYAAALDRLYVPYHLLDWLMDEGKLGPSLETIDDFAERIRDKDDDDDRLCAKAQLIALMKQVGMVDAQDRLVLTDPLA